MAHDGGHVSMVETFRQFDKDGNGTIDKSELAGVLKQLDPQAWTDKKVDILWWALDVNEDGQVSYEEFARWITKPKSGYRACKDHISFEQLPVLDQRALMKEVTELRVGARRGSYFAGRGATITDTVQEEVVAAPASFIEDAQLEAAWTAAEGVSCHLHGIIPRSPEEKGKEREIARFGAMTVLDILPVGFSCQKGSKGAGDTTPNQDNCSLTYFTNGYALVCVFDGHGKDGHVISTRTVQTVPYFLVRSKSFPRDMPSALMEAYVNAQRDAVLHAERHGWDVDMSGTTAVSAVWKGNKVWTANSGDARCVIGSMRSKGIIFETQDHKPQSRSEAARIEAAGGQVRSHKYPDGWVSYRIFKKGTDYPGLCMARTLGDQVAKSIGVIAVPEVHETVLEPEDSPFLVMCSDGIWEFLSSEFVIKACAKSLAGNNIDKTLDRLHREARRRWQREEGEYVDDITSVLVKLWS